MALAGRTSLGGFTALLPADAWAAGWDGGRREKWYALGDGEVCGCAFGDGGVGLPLGQPFCG